jgi:hypothetical protein
MASLTVEWRGRNFEVCPRSNFLIQRQYLCALRYLVTLKRLNVGAQISTDVELALVSLKVLGIRLPQVHHKRPKFIVSSPHLSVFHRSIQDSLAFSFCVQKNLSELTDPWSCLRTASVDFNCLKFMVLSKQSPGILPSSRI